jgi:hypothetical protein
VGLCRFAALPEPTHGLLIDGRAQVCWEARFPVAGAREGSKNRPKGLMRIVAI